MPAASPWDFASGNRVCVAYMMRREMLLMASVPKHVSVPANHPNRPR